MAIKVPENGYLTDSEYGEGWECDHGYRAANDQCIEIKVPANGYLTNSTYGRGWECERGYAPVQGDCVRIVLPRNAYLKDSGDDWMCARNYTRSKDACILAEER